MEMKSFDPTFVYSAMLTRSVLIASVFYCVASLVQASTPTVGAEKRASVSVRFLAFDAIETPCVLQTADGRWTSANISNVYFGQPVRVSTKGPLALFATESSPLAGTNSPPVTTSVISAPSKNAKPLVTAALINSPRQLVFLFKGKDAVRALVMPDSDDHFPFGSVLAINLTNKPIQGFVGKSKITVPPGGRALASNVGVDNKSGDISVRFRGSVNGKDALLYSTIWSIKPDTRMFVFLYEDESGRVLVKPIRDANVPDLVEASESTAVKATSGRKI